MQAEILDIQCMEVIFCHMIQDFSETWDSSAWENIFLVTLYGEVICKVKEGTQSGTKIRLKGKGVVSMKRPDVYGDQYVTVQIEVPHNLSQEAKQKLQEFEQIYRHGAKKRHAAG